MVTGLVGGGERPTTEMRTVVFGVAPVPHTAVLTLCWRVAFRNSGLRPTSAAAAAVKDSKDSSTATRRGTIFVFSRLSLAYRRTKLLIRVNF